MRVGILAQDLTHPEMRGLQRYTAGLVRALTAMPGVELVLFSRSALGRQFDDIPGRREIWPGKREILWEQAELPLRIRKLGIDIFHAPGNRGLPAVTPCPTVLTRHDAIERMFPPDFPGTVRTQFRMFYADEISVHRASRVATVSERSRRDIERIWKLRPGKVVNCGEGIDDRFLSPIAPEEVKRVRERWGLHQPYVLYVGGFDRRKNVRTLLEAFFVLNEPGLMLVLGGSLRGDGEAIQKRICEHPGREAIRVTGYVPDRDLPALYAGCELFVYPSLYEGFGLQAIEAMAAGAPVLVSDGGALPETAGDGAATFPGGQVAACAGAMRTLLAGGTEQLRRWGREQAKRFSWDAIGTNYLRLYQEILN